MPRQIFPEGQTFQTTSTESFSSDTIFNTNLDELTSLTHIQDYLDKKKKLDALKTELAESMYKPFVIQSASFDFDTSMGIYLNNNIILETTFYAYGNTYCAVSVSAFKAIAITLGISYAAFIKETEDVKINIFSFLASAEKKWTIQPNAIFIKS